MSALSEVLDPYRRRIAVDAAALAQATLTYATSTVASGRTDGPFLSGQMRSALSKLDTDIAAARRRVRALPRETPGRSQAYSALGTLAKGYSELRQSLTAVGTQDGIDAAELAEQHLSDGGERLEALRRYLR